MRITKNRATLLVNGILLFIVIIWTIPIAGLLISSIRNRDAIRTSGWWTIFPHQANVTVEERPIPTGQASDQPITIDGITKSFQEWKAGVAMPDGSTLIWEGTVRVGKLVISKPQIIADTNFTLDNYSQVLEGKTLTIQNPDGTVTTQQGENLVNAFLNSLTVAIPSTIIPILIAAFAAYGFAWMKFPGRRWLFIMIVALLVVPLQIALVPILRDYVSLGLNGTFLGIWLAHTGFGLPLACYLLYNYISQLPKDILESAFIDGASHFTMFTRLVLPLSVPALASFAIFQFLWVWNDYLVSLIFIGFGNGQNKVLTMRIADLVGSRGQDWFLLTAAGFVSMIIPLAVFFALQRYFVRGLMAGSVKG
ncbi:MAG: carbohydrate ABC transporter permease [Chloroflexi bacterium]|nr:carbohydrate ABC transporter permease [Chloroflexota bacterium]MCC6894525.1 carbohydrate ABC transporter permease [Anaerolineae bacterium]